MVLPPSSNPPQILAFFDKICYILIMDKIDAVKIRKDLGENLRKHREDAHLTQAEVAEKSGIDVNYYARIERGLGNPSYVKLYSIMTTLKMESLKIK